MISVSFFNLIRPKIACSSPCHTKFGPLLRKQVEQPSVYFVVAALNRFVALSGIASCQIKFPLARGARQAAKSTQNLACGSIVHAGPPAP
jgi:hypothetical protein